MAAIKLAKWKDKQLKIKTKPPNLKNSIKNMGREEGKKEVWKGSYEHISISYLEHVSSWFAALQGKSPLSQE